MTPALLATTALSEETSTAQASFLHAVLEGFADGTLVFDITGQLLHANRKGQQLCRQLQGAEAAQAPPEIWTLCAYLVESRDLFPEPNLVISHTLSTHTGDLRVRVQWFQLGEPEQPQLLVTLEDQTQTDRCAALFEARRFHLTERETEVWLLRKAGRSYEEIAKTLFIANNTVKRHLKSIYAKRKQSEDLEEA